ncbi:MAG: GFA family protein [Alphaproteobacteria bacterium]|nr:MAG: GFA family protein [Alphaproteobacteria bacterium]
MTKETISGGCLCGAVVFEFDTPSLWAAHCHCTMCRRAHGAAYVTWVGVRESGFRITKGDADLVHYDSSDHLTRSFCGRCGSSILCNDHRHDSVIDITLANLHSPLDRAVSSHIYFDCRAGWVDIDDDLQKRGGDTGLEPL